MRDNDEDRAIVQDALRMAGEAARLRTEGAEDSSAALFAQAYARIQEIPQGAGGKVASVRDLSVKLLTDLLQRQLVDEPEPPYARQEEHHANRHEPKSV